MLAKETSVSQTITTFQHNISQHCWAQYVARVWPPCCDMFRHVGCSWLKLHGQIFPATFVDVAWCCSHLARFVQQCCARACALVRFSTANMSQHVEPKNVAICCVQMLRSFGRTLQMLGQQRWHMLCCYAAIVWRRLYPYPFICVTSSVR